MHKLHCRVFFMIIATMGITASVPAGSVQVIQTQELPSEIAALVPQGAQVTFQSFVMSPLSADIRFSAEKKSGARSGALIRYNLTFHSFDNDDTWKLLAPNYRTNVERDGKQKERDFAQASSYKDSMVSPPQVTQYPWGWGVTQRTRRHGEGAPDFFDYRCAYFGVAGSTVFELTVEEIPDRAEADQWATKVAETAAKTSRSSVSK